MPLPVNLTNAARRTEEFLFRYGAWLVFLMAVLYYAQYYRSGLNPGGEGGTVAVVAMRLMEGQRPIVDTFLGYNVLWFYPVAWLFELTGPNYLALRIYFFALCTLTGLLAFFIVRRVSGCGWFAVLAAMGPVLIPGMIFRNYMGFLAMLNMLCLLQAYVFEQRSARRQILWMALAGGALGVTYLVRIDLGGFFTVITLGLIVLFPWGKKGEALRRAGLAGAGLALTFGLFVLTHAPVYSDAARRGYLEAFAGQYTGWIGIVHYLAAQQLAKPSAPAAQTPAPAPAPKPAAASPPKAEANNRDLDSEDYAQRRKLRQVFEAPSFYERAFVLATYLPVPAALLIVVFSGGGLFFALLRRDFARRTDALILLVTTGSALTLFPQYFFFRPDTPHLSEFMAPFIVALACAGWIFWRRAGSPAARAGAGLLIALFAADAGLYFYHSFPKESAGTIAAKSKRQYELVAENGVRVFLKRQECEELRELCAIIKTHTKPGDYLVAFPYSPTINFMTDRPSYLGNLYVDNAHNVSEFHQFTLGQIEKYRPAAIVVDNRDINHTEESRFKNWAAETYAWIRSHYSYAGTFRRQEVYLRPDLYPEKFLTNDR